MKIPRIILTLLIFVLFIKLSHEKNMIMYPMAHNCLIPEASKNCPKTIANAAIRI